MIGLPVPARVLAEGAVYGAALVAFLSLPPVASYAARLPRAHRWFLATLLGLLIVGQVVNDSRLTYPFPSWAMYGQPEQATEVVFYRYEGQARTGETVELDVPRLLAPIPRDGIITKIGQLADRAARNGDAQDQLKALLRAAATVHARRHPEQVLSAVTIIGHRLDPRAGRSGLIRRERVMRVDL